MTETSQYSFETDLAKHLDSFCQSKGIDPEQVERTLCFKLADLQVIDVQKSDPNIPNKTTVESGNREWTLANGRIISIEVLHQFRTYRSWIQGVPHPYEALWEALEAVNSIFQVLGRQPQILAPALYRTMEVTRHSKQTQLKLPEVCCIAELTSEPTAKGGTLRMCASVAHVIWFQEQFSLKAMSTQTVNQLRSLQWDDIAEDFNY